MAGVVFTDGTVLTAAQLNAAMDQKADVVNPQFKELMAIPQGPTSQRPAAPAQFTFRGNTDSGLPEIYIGGAWVSLDLGSKGNAPSPPSPLIVGTVTTSAIPVSWGASTGSGTITYQVQYQIAGATAWTNWGGASNALAATITGLQPNTKYNIQVIAANQFGQTISATASTRTLGVAPNAPTNLAVDSTTSQTMQVSWDGSTTGTPPIAYQLYFMASGGAGFVAFGSPISGTGEVITGLTPDTVYFAYVVAQNSGGSATSLTVSGTTAAAAGVSPNAPTGLTTSNVGENGLTLSWTASSAGDTPINYTVFGKAQSDAGYTQLGSPSTAVSQNLSGLNPATSYTFYVVASNSAGSAQSNTVSATTATVTPGSTGQTWGTQYSSLAVPVLQGPVAGQVATGTALAISGLTVNDPPAASASGNCTLTVSCNRNAGTVSSTDASGNPVAGSGTSTISGYLGSLSSIGTVLRNLVYTAPSTTMSDVITISYTDQLSKTTQMSVTMTVVTATAPATAWGKSSLAGPGTIATDGTGTTALRAQDVLSGLGVQTRLDKNPSPYVGALAQVENAINYLGVTMIKDSPDPASASQDTSWYPQIKNNVQLISPLQFWLQIGSEASSQFQPQTDLFVQMAASGYVVGFQNMDAADVSSPDGLAAVENFQPTLSTAAHNAGVKVSSFSITSVTDPTTVPVVSNVDYALASFSPVDTPFDGYFTGAVTAATTFVPNKPLLLGSFGWQSFPEGGSAPGGVSFASVNAVAAYALVLIFDATLMGFVQYYWTNLVDDPDDYGGPTTFGLFDSSWNPKPAAKAIRNMNLLMMDQSSNARTFTPGKLDFSVDTTVAGIDQLGLHTQVLQRGDGSFFLVLWNEQILQDLSNYPNQTNAEITVNPINVGVTLTTSATAIAVYDPMVGTTAVQTGSGTSITVSVPAHPVFVEIVRP